MVCGELVTFTAVDYQNVLLEGLRYFLRNSFNVGCELIQRKEDLNYDVTVSRCYLRYFADSWVSGDVAETPLADVGHRGLVESMQVLPSAGRTGMQA